MAIRAEFMAETYPYVVSRYARRKGEIRARLLKDQDFRALCEEYEEARRALSRGSYSAHSKAKLRAAEFAKISRELEVKIERFLDEND